MSDTLLGVIIGGFIATAAPIVVELIRGRREQHLDKAKRADDRRIGRDAFQRETLLDLMDAITVWRGTMRALWDEKILGQASNGGNWPRGWSGEVDSAIETSLSKSIALRERVLDDDVRAAVVAAIGQTRPFKDARSLDDARSIYVDIIADADLAIEAAGKAVRRLYSH